MIRYDSPQSSDDGSVLGVVDGVLVHSTRLTGMIGADRGDHLLEREGNSLFQELAFHLALLIHIGSAAATIQLDEAS